MGLALVLCLGLPGHLPIPAGTRALMAWALLLGSPLLILPEAGVFGILLPLVLPLSLGALLPLPLVLGGGIWLASVLLLQPFAKKINQAIPKAALVVALLLAVGVTVLHPGIGLQSDGPAHAGAIEDALNQNRWRPLEASWAGATAKVDPRFGSIHGLSGWIASSSQSSGIEVLRYGAGLLAALGFLTFHVLFGSLGLSGFWLLVVALWMSILGGDGRGLALWTASYPGNISFLMATLGAAGLLWGKGKSLPGAILLGASAAGHPFGWFAWGAVLGLALLVRDLRERFFTPKDWGWLGAAGLLGFCLLLPSLLMRDQVAGGLHDFVTDVVFLGDGSFIADPLVMMRWGGVVSLLGLVPLLVAGRQPWRGSLPQLAMITGFLPLYLVAFNPLLAPSAWDLVGYLIVRLGRLLFTPALVWLAWGWAKDKGFVRGNLLRASAILLLVAQGFLGLGWLAEGQGRSAAADGWETPRELDELLPAGASYIADPRLSYGLRALRGGPTRLYPVAHASPADWGLESRLRDWRALLSPWSSGEEIQRRLKASEAEWLVLDRDPSARYGGPEYGYVPSGQDQQRLLDHLLAAGVVAEATGESWTLLRLKELPALEFSAEPPRCQAGSVNISLELSHSRLFHLSVEPSSVMAGEILEIHTHHTSRVGASRTATPNWERVHLRIQASDVEDWGRWPKPLRKLLVDRKGRSRHRAGFSWVPFRGLAPQELSGEEAFCETVRWKIPSYLPPGLYEIQPTVQESPWRARRGWRDYLSDEDRWSAPPFGSIEIRPPGPEVSAASDEEELGILNPQVPSLESGS